MENQTTYKQIREAMDFNIVHRDTRILIATNECMYNIVIEYDNANATFSKNLNLDNLGSIVLERDTEVEKEEAKLDENLSIIHINANKLQEIAYKLLILEVANDVVNNNIDIASIRTDLKANGFDAIAVVDDALKNSNTEHLVHIGKFRTELTVWHNRIKSEYKMDIQEIEDDAEDISRAKIKYDEIIKNAENTEAKIQRGYELLAID